MSYTDFSIEGAKEKLDCVIESARENISDYLVADDFDIKPIEYEATISENNKFFMCLGMGLGVGVALAILLILLIILFDNTVKDIDDIEEIVDANFMGYIENMNNK